MSETRRFQMNPKLLLDVMKRQAGTLSKAILEGVMNSVDAKATECKITTTAKGVLIEDNGQGFRSRDEIEQWFEVFGAPHTEAEGKTYGTFRMGRGQMFAFGANIWRTGHFMMDVDIEKRGLDYTLKDEKKNHKGCLIEIKLYSELLPSDLAELERNLEVWVKYCPVPVYLNGRTLSSDPEDEKWDHVTPEAYIRLKPNGSLVVYNLGIHVLDLAGYRFGTGGVVVSRKQLKVNFARNDIQSDCKVWKSVKLLVDKSAAAKIVTKKALTDDERQRLADKLLQGEITIEAVSETGLITAATGRHCTIRAFAYPGEFPQVTNAPRGNRKADNLMRSRMAFVVANETLDRFHVKSVKALVDKLAPICNGYGDWWTKMRIVDFETLTKGLGDAYEVLDEKELLPREQLWLGLMSKGLHRLIPNRNNLARAGVRCRKLKIGVSDTAEGWTDGATYICVSRAYLAKQEFNIQGFVAVGGLLLHELCHHSPDLEEHDHDQGFYEEFHDDSECIGDFAAFVLSCVPQMCQSVGRKMTGAMLRNQDQMVKASQALTTSNIEAKAI